ncbi:phosphoglycerate mutase family protein, putative [Entamoeba histolytica HM-1:IMSS-B]|nr:phosphoglycerate mutase family protein, putative [Entamoeba histolytica HM-1:IMSS-B]GAT99310.1 phosphoglycerate mutase family protein putative [Entamoeba histolytica]
MEEYHNTTKDYENPRGIIIYINMNERDDIKEEIKCINSKEYDKVIKGFKEIIKDKEIEHYEIIGEYIDLMNEQKEKIKGKKGVMMLFTFDCNDTHDQLPKISIIKEEKEGNEEINEEYDKLINNLQELHNEYTNQPKLFIVRHAVRHDYIDLKWVPTAQYPHDPPLHIDGIKQAEEVGRRMRHEKIDVIVSSPYLRATGTAREIAKYNNMKYGIEPGASEFLSKVNRKKVPEFDPIKYKDPYYDDQYQPIIKEVVLETWEEIQQRAFKTILELTKKYKRVCFVTHRSTQQAFMSKIIGKTIKDNYAFTSVCTFKPIETFPFFIPQRMNSYYHLRTFIETPIHNPNYYIEGNYKDMVRGDDGKILPSGYV